MRVVKRIIKAEVYYQGVKREGVEASGLEQSSCETAQLKSQLFQVCPVFVVNQGLPWESWDRIYFSYLMYL